jgi:hypothetical protein
VKRWFSLWPRLRRRNDRRPRVTWTVQRGRQYDLWPSLPTTINIDVNGSQVSNQDIQRAVKQAIRWQGRRGK